MNNLELGVFGYSKKQLTLSKLEWQSTGETSRASHARKQIIPEKQIFSYATIYETFTLNKC